MFPYQPYNLPQPPNRIRHVPVISCGLWEIILLLWRVHCISKFVLGYSIQLPDYVVQILEYRVRRSSNAKQNIVRKSIRVRRIYHRIYAIVHSRVVAKFLNISLKSSKILVQLCTHLCNFLSVPDNFRHDIIARTNHQGAVVTHFLAKFGNCCSKFFEGHKINLAERHKDIVIFFALNFHLLNVFETCLVQHFYQFFVAQKIT